jgi:hypothetical protein
MVRILWAFREAAGDPSVAIEDLFEFDVENTANWVD